MFFDLAVPSQLMLAVLPEIVVIVGAMILLLWAGWGPDTPERTRQVTGGAAIVSTIALALVCWLWASGTTVTPGLIAADNFRWASSAIVLIGTILTLLLAIDYNERLAITSGEAAVLVLLATAGMMLLVAARDLMIVFLGVELMSIAIYVLAGIDRRSAKGAEAALKYFLLGSFSSAFLLYGIALVYGAVGSANLTVIGDRLADPLVSGGSLFTVGLALLLVGFGFKVAVVPFHMWTPDVYDGAPTPYTAYMASAVKAAAFAAFLRVTLEALPNAFEQWHTALWWLAAITMVGGNIVALAQRNLKRMLAYSSIAHAGYLLVALVTGTSAGVAALVFYLLAYSLATIGAFAVVSSLAGPDDRMADLERYTGLWTVRPGLAVAMAVFMLALLGFPLAGGIGFFAKWYVLQAALQAPSPQTRLAVLLVITSAISAGYYLYVIVVMFMRPRDPAAAVPREAQFATKFVIAASVAVILALGIYPNPIVRLARSSAPADRAIAPPVLGGGTPLAQPAPLVPAAALVGAP